MIISTLYRLKRHYGNSKYRFSIKSVTMRIQSIAFQSKASLWEFKVTLSTQFPTIPQKNHKPQQKKTSPPELVLLGS